MKSGFDIPGPMRDFAERSVDQARKAFDDFMSAAQKTVDQFDGSGGAVQDGARRLHEETMAFAEANVTASFELANRLVRARNVEEMVEIQQDYLRQQMAAFAEQNRRLSEIAGQGRRER